MLLVITMTVFLKFTVRPWPSVRRPSSSTWSSTLKTSRWAFSISSKRITRIGPPANGFGQPAALFVADISGRCADQAGDGMLLHELAHVDADHGVFIVEEKLGQRLAQFGFADAGGAEEQERCRSGDSGSPSPARLRRTASETARTASSWPMTRCARRSSIFSSFSRSPSSMRLTGTPVQRLTTSAISSAVTSSFTSALPSTWSVRAAVCSACSICAFEVAHFAVLNAGGRLPSCPAAGPAPARPACCRAVPGAS